MSTASLIISLIMYSLDPILRALFKAHKVYVRWHI